MSHTRPFLRFMTMGIAVALLSACGGKDKETGEKTVTMHDMEVVDGTASDAMTDLDGVQTGGIAVPPAASADGVTRAATGTDNSATESDKKTNEDVTADQ